MNTHRMMTALWTLVSAEVRRFLRVWIQTLLPAVVTAVLYYLIFGKLMGGQTAPMGTAAAGNTYLQFLAPGMVMMTVITGAYMNTVSSLYFAKFVRSIEEILVSPVPYLLIIAGYVIGGVVRGVIVGMLVLLVALFFTSISIYNLGIVLLFLVLTAVLFALAGLINGIFAKSFDSISIFPTFVLTPLTYLGGVFYSVSVLPPFWQALSYANPILYMVNGFRYGFLGVADTSVWLSLGVLTGLIVIAGGVTVYLFEKGKGLRP